MKKSFLTAAILTIVFSGPAFADLSNTKRRVTSVDITKEMAIIWVNGVIVGSSDCRPGRSEHHTVACFLDEPICDKMVIIAFGAKLADKKVEFDTSGNCTCTLTKS